MEATLDLIEVFTQLGKVRNRYIALLLTDVEHVLGNTNEYITTRKLILDHFNDYTRALARVIIGDEIEGLKYR